MADLNELRKILQKFESSLKATSFDKDNEIYLCHSNQNVYNFDTYTQDKYKVETPKSFDALYLPDNNLKTVICIEFRNVSLPKIDIQEIFQKYQDGFSELVSLFNEKNIPIKDYKFYFFLVHKNAKYAQQKHRHRNLARDKTSDLTNKSKGNFGKANATKFFIKALEDTKSYYLKYFDFPSNCL